MYLTQHWVSYTTSFDIKTKTSKIGTLYRRNISMLLTYDFYDNSNNLMTSATARLFSLGAHFDVYDTEKALLGTVEENIITFFPSFTLYSPNGAKLARAEMNFWGTSFYIYEGNSNNELAIMSRSYFRVKNDWTIDIKNKDRLKAKNIDPGLFLTVLAFQGDREYWEEQEDNKRSLSDQSSNEEVSYELQQKIRSLMANPQLNEIELLDPDTLERLAIKLETDYRNQNKNKENESSQEKISVFVNYCLNLIESEQTKPAEKKAILYLLQQRMGFNNQ